MPGHGEDNDWPAEAKGVERISEKEARKLSHDVPDTDDDKAKVEHLRQLDDEAAHGHPAAHLRDRDDI